MLLHSVIPHKHSNELVNSSKDEIFAEADGIVDYIKLMFLTDLGAGHMETFDQGKGNDLNLGYQLEVVSDIAVFINKHSYTSLSNTNYTLQTRYTDDIPIIRPYFLSNIDFRGPPIIS